MCNERKVMLEIDPSKFEGTYTEIKCGFEQVCKELGQTYKFISTFRWSVSNLDKYDAEEFRHFLQLQLKRNKSNVVHISKDSNKS